MKTAKTQSPPAADIDRRGPYRPEAMRAAVEAAARVAKETLEASSKEARRVPHPPAWAQLRPLVHASPDVAARDALLCLLLAEVQERAEDEAKLAWLPHIHPRPLRGA